MSRLVEATVFLALGCAIGCGRFGFDPTTGDGDGDGDGDLDASSASGDGSTANPDGGSIDPLGLFNTPALVPGLSGLVAFDPTLTADQLLMGLILGGDIFTVDRTSTSEAFEGLRDVPVLNSGSIEATPEIAPLGDAIYFASNRGGDHDIYLSVGEGTPSVPVAVNELNSYAFDSGPSVTFDELTIVFVSERGGNRDLYQASRVSTDQPFGAPAALSKLNTIDDESAPFLSANGLELYFCSKRSGGFGADDIYVTTRTSIADSFSAPRPMTELNSAGSECGVWLSPDRHDIYFSSDRSGANRIYQANR